MELDMAIYDEILEVLSFERGEALDANEVFSRCKGINDRNAVSTALSQMYKNHGTIDREDNVIKGGTRFRYWKKATAESNQVKQAEAAAVGKTAEADVFEIPQFLRKDSQIDTAPYIEKQATEDKSDSQTLLPLEEAKDDQKEKTYFFEPTSLAKAIDIVASHLPDFSAMKIERDGSDNLSIQLDLDDEDVQLEFEYATDVQPAIDAFKTIRRYKRAA
jgi:hypothetical protein